MHNHKWMVPLPGGRPISAPCKHTKWPRAPQLKDSNLSPLGWITTQFLLSWYVGRLLAVSQRQVLSQKFHNEESSLKLRLFGTSYLYLKNKHLDFMSYAPHMWSQGQYCYNWPLMLGASGRSQYELSTGVMPKNHAIFPSFIAEPIVVIVATSLILQ